MAGDLLFPFPEPDFLFVHKVYVVPASMLNMHQDERGGMHPELPEFVGGVPPVEPVMGYLTAPNASRDYTGYIERQKIEAVCLLPLSFPIEADAIIHCIDEQLPPHLKGTYNIDMVRQTISHQRIMCQRYRLNFGVVTL